MKLLPLAAALTLAAMPAAGGQDVAHQRLLEFPDLSDGRHVLAVDLHTHSVFSDGAVWPTIRVQEAERDGLFAYAVTEHMEDESHRYTRDIPQPDRNRSYQVAVEAARGKTAATPGHPVQVIPGTEITRSMPPGHVNAVFVTDVNEIARGNETTKGDPGLAIATANRQGAFVFWNHPFFWETDQKPDGMAALFPIHREWIRRGWLHGIEVANGIDSSDEAFQIALDHHLTILGTSDIHGLIDWDYRLEKGQQRTVTLVLSPERTLDALKAALFRGDTVALENATLLGRPENMQALLGSVLHLKTGGYIKPGSTVIAATLVNDSPIDFILENVGKESIYQGTNVFTVPAHSSYELLVDNMPDPAALGLTLRAVSAYVAPRKHPDIRLQGRR